MPLLPSLAGDNFGGLLIGGFWSTALWGMSCMQVFTYFNTPSKDHPLLKYTMVFLMIVNTLHTLLIEHLVYFYLIILYGNATSANHIVWSETAAILLTDVTNFIIRCLFARRVWLLSQGNKWVVCLICTFVFPTLPLAIAYAVMLYRLPEASFLHTGSGIYATARLVGYVSFAFGIMSELCITSAMCYYLYKSRTTFARTNTLIKVLIQYSITTGLLVTVFSALGLILLTAVPSTNWSCILYFVESNLYVNSYLAALNAREGLRHHPNDHMSVPLYRISASLPEIKSDPSYETMTTAREKASP